MRRTSRGNPDYFQHTIVEYTQHTHVTDRGLRLVLQTRPYKYTTPNIRRPSTLSGAGSTLYVQPMLLPTASFITAITGRNLPSATLRLCQAGIGLY